MAKTEKKRQTIGNEWYLMVKGCLNGQKMAKRGGKNGQKNWKLVVFNGERMLSWRKVAKMVKKGI